MQLQQSWRWGQSVFNTLYAMHPAFANTIRDTERDMYHRDENVELLKTYIKTNQDD